MLKCPELEAFVVKDMYHSNGLEFISLNGGLSLQPIEKYESVLADNLLVLTQICKQSKEYYPGVQMAYLGPDMLELLRGPSKFLKVKVCNLIGQMCKHSDFFYSELREANIFPEMIQLCSDQDKVVKKASSFAIGNAAYYSSSLYPDLSPAIGHIVLLLKDKDERIKTNSIGTISNLTRNSDCLVPELLKHLVFEPVTPKVLVGAPISNIEKVYKTPAPDFELSQLRIYQKDIYRPKQDSSPQVIIAVEGEGMIINNSIQVPFKQGESFFIEANVPYKILPKSDALLFKARVPV